MKEFKFLSKNDTLTLNGQMSIEAIQYFNDYVSRIIRYEITTTIATYKMVDYTYGNGSIVAGTVNAYPLEDSSMRVVYHIRNGGITSFTVEYDYWRTVGQAMNAINDLRQYDL
jgi:hypothetical protein